MNNNLAQTPVLVNTGHGSYLVSSPENELDQIIAAANAIGQNVKHHVVDEDKGGKIICRVNRGYLVFEVWPPRMGPVIKITLATWDGKQWQSRTTIDKLQAWWSEAQDILIGKVQPRHHDPVALALRNQQPHGAIGSPPLVWQYRR